MLATRSKLLLFALTALTALTTSAPVAFAADQLPVDGEEFILQGRVFSLDAGYVFGQPREQAWVMGGYDFKTGGVNLLGGAGRRLIMGPTYLLRLAAQAGPTLFIYDTPTIAARLSSSLINEWALSWSTLFIGPKLDAAAAFGDTPQRRVKALAVGGLGFDVFGARLWLDFEAGYSFGGAGRGAVELLGGLTLELDRSCGCEL